MIPKKYCPKQQTSARAVKAGHTNVWTIAVITLILLFIPSGLICAEEPESQSDARDKLLAMVAGDISRSLAVENSTEFEPSELQPFAVAGGGYPSSSVYVVGYGTNGQLGIGTSSDTNIPQLLPDMFGGPIESGIEHSLVTDRNEDLWFTGVDHNGQFGDGSTNSSTPTLTKHSNSDIKEIKDVAVGNYHSLVLLNDGTVMAAGEGSSGQLGTGTGTDTDEFTIVLVSDAVKVTAWENNSYAINDLGELFAFGANLSGGLGIGTVGLQADTPVKIIPAKVIDVAPGSGFALALMDNGAVMAMGLNTYGQFGDGTTDSSLTPKLVIDSGVKAIAAGVNFSMFLLADGSLQSVGNNSYGQLGFGDTAARLTRTTVTDGVSAIAAGRGHGLYITDNGVLMGTGNNSYGQLGLGDFSDRITPSVIDSGVVEVMSGSNTTFFMKNSLNSLEIKGLTTVYSGANTTFPQATANFDCYAHWADGSTTPVTEKVFWTENSDNAAIELNSGILDITNADAGENIRITASYFDKTATWDITVVRPPVGSTLYGSGFNAYSQLGLDTTINMASAMKITDANVITAAGGFDHSLYVLEDGRVFTMGNNAYGQLGTGDTVPRTTPAQIDLPVPAIDVSAGLGHSLIVFRDGSLRTMGLNSEGQLGDGSQFNRKTPTRIRDGGVIQADGGAGHSVFLTADGEAWTMGRGIEGQLGNGSTSGSNNPYMAFGTSEKATTVAAGNNHTIFKTEDGKMWGMGDNSSGQLGLISSVINQLSPIELVTSSVADIAAGAKHTMYRSITKQIFITGNNDYRQLGMGTAGINLYGFTQLAGYSNVNEVYGGGTFSMFRDGVNLLGMGDNSRGQLADGTFTSHGIPTILPINDARQLALGDRHTLFRLGILGDLNDDLQYTLQDVIIGLQTLTGDYDGEFYLPIADINSDSRVGLPEVLFNLKKCAAP